MTDHDTSPFSWAAYQQHIASGQDSVYRRQILEILLAAHGEGRIGLSRQTLVGAMGKPINVICSAVKDLLNRNMIAVVGREDGDTGAERGLLGVQYEHGLWQLPSTMKETCPKMTQWAVQRITHLCGQLDDEEYEIRESLIEIREALETRIIPRFDDGDPDGLEDGLGVT